MNAERILALLAMLAGMAFSLSARTAISGVVTDSVTSETLGFVNVFLPASGHGVITKENGSFTIHATVPQDTIVVTSMGYSTRRIPLSSVDLSKRLKIRMAPRDRSLNEIVVRPGKIKYSKRNNPAVELMERVRSNAHRSDPRRRDFEGHDSYEKITLALNDFNVKEDDGSWMDRKFGFIREYIDTSAFTGSAILNLSVKERRSKHLQKGSTHKEVVLGEKSVGIDSKFETEEMTKFLRDVLRPIDVYGNDITLMQNRFVSPLSRIGANYYMYFLTDTLDVDGTRCAELAFTPHNPESFGFNGKLYVALDDTTGFVKRVKMQVPRSINLNYVKNLYVEQTFERDSLGTRQKVNDDMVVEMQILPGTQELYARRHEVSDQFDYTPDGRLVGYFGEEGEVVLIPGYDRRDAEFWDAERLEPLTGKESSVANLMDRMREVKLFYWGEKILSVLVKGYIFTGTPSKVDLGPVNTLFSYNALEGARFRVGGMTTANLSPRWFARGYLAYGTRDRKLKYSAEVEHSFTDKKYHSREFPINSLRLLHSYDVDQIGQHYLFTNPDNIFLALKRKENKLMTYRRLTTLDYTMERRSGFSFSVSLNHEVQESSRFLTFENGFGEPFRSYSQASLKVKLRYAPGETFYQMASERLPINLDAPVVQLTHEFGPKGFLGSAYTLNKTELMVQKRFWFSAFGYADVFVKGGILWDQVQYPALTWANANLSYTVQPESFALMSPMEFATDRYVSWDLTYWLNGAIFNRIPLVKKLKMREVLAFRGYWGALTDKNNPALHPELFRFPADADVYTMDKTPYMEISAGLDNILTFLRVDYVYRLTYRWHPNVDRWGIRVALHFTF